ncbi:hypothetical protein [Polaribacter sp. IC073]|uniref:hypothetical protein n=1 Tax=Polaribacter sp. IC073 TaxID=2508540 RepID=UPI0011BF467B|nr:hypothetical protein [Polaribacter sp. IC073]TXD48665.1 hypothetical protein ES045_05415 [Polaribacter sp. IC073]
MFHNIWELPETKNFKVSTIYEIDEIIMAHGASPYDEDYKIKRVFYKYEWEGLGVWEKIFITKEEYFQNYHIQDEQYITELNYSEFQDKFWFEILESDLIDNLIPNGQFSFLKKVNQLIINSESDSKSKFYLNSSLKGLKEVIDQLVFLDSQAEINEIQKFVIKSYIPIYIGVIEYLIEEYELIYPDIINKFKSQNYNQPSQENPYPKIFSNNKAYLLFQKLHEAYKDEKKDQANYSFIYYRMKADKLILCTGKYFINFLIEFDITPSKIDSRQKNELNNKVPFYNNTRDFTIGKADK